METISKTTAQYHGGFFIYIWELHSSTQAGSGMGSPPENGLAFQEIDNGLTGNKGCADMPDSGDVM